MIALASVLGSSSVLCTPSLAYSLGETLVLAVESGSCEQEKPKTSEGQNDRRTGASFLSLTLRLRDDGTSEIVRATQVDGKLIERQGPATEYVYEIVKDGKSFAVGFLPEGTFALRGFKPENGGREKTGRTDTATVTLNVPGTELDAAKQGKIALRIYKIRPGVELDAISPGVLKKLVTTEKASVQFELSSATIAAQTKEVQRPTESPK